MATKKHLAYLFPCALLEDFTFAELATTILTEEKNKWSTTDNGALTITLNDVYGIDNRKSLKLDINTSGNEEAVRGIDGTDYDHTSICNAFGSTGDSLTPFNTMGMWVYSTDFDQADEANMIKIGYYYATASEASSSWNSSAGTTDEWLWFDDAVTLSGGNIERCFIRANKANGGDVYCNTLVAFKRSTSNRDVATDSADNGTNSATGLFDWENGLSFISTGLTDNFAYYTLSGILDPEYYRESVAQLKAMVTVGLKSHPLMKQPYPKYSTLRDPNGIKTYLFQIYSKGTEESSKVITKSVPVILSNLNLNHASGKPHVIKFSVRLNKFVGV